MARSRKNLLFVASLAVATIAAAPASAHRNICHTNHACPSDHHTYLWRGLSCTSKLGERMTSDKRVVKFAALRYFCHKGK